MKIIRKDDVDKFTKNYIFQSICELNDDLVLIIYNSRMNEKIRNLYKNDLDKIEDAYLFNLTFSSADIPINIFIIIYYILQSFIIMSLNCSHL